jgi:hypothetical protein
LLEVVTVAVNCFVSLVKIDAEVGQIVTETTGGVLTVIIAEADLVASAALLPSPCSFPCVPLVKIDSDVGEMETATMGALTVTVADADFVLSAALMALTV